jgi:hypothetical protein
MKPGQKIRKAVIPAAAPAQRFLAREGYDFASQERVCGTRRVQCILEASL